MLLTFNEFSSLETCWCWRVSRGQWSLRCEGSLSERAAWGLQESKATCCFCSIRQKSNQASRLKKKRKRLLIPKYLLNLVQIMLSCSICWLHCLAEGVSQEWREHCEGCTAWNVEIWEPFSGPVYPDGEATGRLGVIGRGRIGDLSSGIDKLVNREGGGVKMDMSDTSAFVSSGEKHQPAMA